VGFTKKGSDKRGEASFALAAGGEAVVKDEAAHLKPGFYLLLSILSQKHSGTQGLKPKVLCVLKLEEGWLLDECPTWLSEENRVAFDSGSKSVKADTRMKFGELVLDEGPVQNAEAKAKIADVLWQAARERPLSEFCGEGQPDRYLARRDFALTLGLRAEDLPDEEGLWGILREFCRQGAMSFDDLRKLDPLRQVMLKLPAHVARQFERSAPKSVKLPSGREVSIQYERGKPPFVASRLQDFFGLRDTPSISGKPLTLHLLAPNQRPQQVTNDLAGFWEREYPRVRSELSRKYPRHKWPEDPLNL
jgi:ATP-dependent helicase HrpB